MGISILIVLAIFASIGLGYLTNINIGFFGLTFSFIIGAFLMGLTPSQIIALWPIQLFFIFFSVTFFYSFATSDGTLEKIALNVIYICRNRPYLLAIAIFLLGIVLSAMGAGVYAVLALLIPTAVMLADKSGMNPLLATLAAAFGAGAGSNFMTSVGGVIIKSLIVNSGLAKEATTYTLYAFLNVCIFEAVLMTIMYFVFKGHKIRKIDVEKPEPFTKEQKINLYILISVVIIMVGPAILGTVIHNNPLIELIKAKVDIGFVGILASVFVILFKTGDEKKAFRMVPWSTIMTICGVGTLIGVAVKAGTIQMLATWVGSSVPKEMVPLIVILISGAMTLIASGYGVVMPALFPVMPQLAQITGIAPSILYSLVVMAVFAAGTSPFSSGGGLIMASLPNDEMRKKYLPIMLFIIAPVNVLVVVALCYLGIFIR